MRQVKKGGNGWQPFELVVCDDVFLGGFYEAVSNKKCKLCHSQDLVTRLRVGDAIVFVVPAKCPG